MKKINDMNAFPATREDALSRLHEFVVSAKRYSGARNFLTDGHTNVSRLSAAIRHRLITEEEVVQTILARHEFSDVEKFLQEVCWRTYWKGWLAQHPNIWANAAHLRCEPPCELAQTVMNGVSGCDVMDDFTNDLKTTGYLHNHARMWWAAFWVHHLKLPWAQGADFFMRHLLDADPASNTLSWRWVAGLHTAGKSYLARPDNIRRYHPHCRTRGLDELQHTVATIPPDDADSSFHVIADWPVEWNMQSVRPKCLLIHPEDLSVERSALKDLQPQVVISVSFCEKYGSAQQHSWREMALADAEQRATNHYGVAVIRCDDMQKFAHWLEENQQYEIYAMAPHIGSLADDLFAVTKEHAQRMCWLQRPWDQMFFPAAKSGFFSFWKKIGKAETFRRLHP